MARPALHQFLVGATVGDAITDQALLIRRWLREDGFRSELFAAHIHPNLGREVRPYLHYRPRRAGELVVLHHSIGSALVDDLLGRGVRWVLVYHNVTPADFFRPVDPALALELEQGRAQLDALRPRTVLPLADSAYNARELAATGYPDPQVLPIALDPARYELAPNPALIERWRDGGPNLLFVGRLAPNKRQDDLIRLLHALRRIRPSARLFLVGSPWAAGYAESLHDLARVLGVDDAVVFAGHVSQRDLVTWYRLAHLYVSMSEHEGFGKPLVESMLLGVPVLAYAAAAVVDTLGGAGVLFRHKQYEPLAELVDLLCHDGALRARVVSVQRRRAASFLAPAVRECWRGLLAQTLEVGR